ncbi:MAG TPA: hypothetical protein VIM37_00065 [Candidatus Microsaccharimonas sp.]|jgi:hypothetical protein
MFLRSGGRNEYAADSYNHASSRSGGDGIGRGVFYVIIGLIALIVGCIIPQLIPESVAYNTAEGLGFTNVKVISRAWLFIQYTGCDTNDSVKFTVEGTNTAGKQQTFYVCAGLFKGGTPRFP